MYRWLFTLCWFLASQALSGHIYGGEFRYTHVSGTTYDIDLTLWTRPSAPGDLPEVVIDLGDGTMDTVLRASITPLVFAGCEMQLNVYPTLYTFPGPGTYTLRLLSGARDIQLDNLPMPGVQPACITAVLVIAPGNTPNNSVRFDSLQHQARWDWSTWVHDPGAVDLDGDSLSFELVTPLGAACQPVAGYQLPAATNYLWVDPLSGVMLWDMPLASGEFSLVLRCSEWRQGQFVGRVDRDMTACIGLLPSAIAELDTSPGLLIGPTPGTDRVQVTLPAEVSWQVKIFSGTGALVWQGSTASRILLVDISTWPVGTYVVQARSADVGALHGRLLKQ